MENKYNHLSYQNVETIAIWGNFQIHLFISFRCAPMNVHSIGSKVKREINVSFVACLPILMLLHFPTVPPLEQVWSLYLAQEYKFSIQFYRWHDLCLLNLYYH